MSGTTKKKVRETIAEIICVEGELNGPGGHPFARIRLNREHADKLLEHLEACATGDGREWCALTWSHDKPERLRITKETDTRKYIRQASQIYLHGQPVRVSGKDGSCNITFSGAVGGRLLAERIGAARQAMREFFDIRIPDRKWNITEYVPDTELEAQDDLEHRKLALAGESSVGDVWPNDDFGDWESADV